MHQVSVESGVDNGAFYFHRNALQLCPVGCPQGRNDGHAVILCGLILVHTVIKQTILHPVKGIAAVRQSQPKLVIFSILNAQVGDILSAGKGRDEVEDAGQLDLLGDAA